MKKVFLFLIFIYGQLFGLEQGSTLKIYHNIFSALSPNASIAVYTTDEEYREVFSHSKRIFLSRTLEASDIVLITDERTLRNVLYRIKVHTHISKKHILFVTNYQLLKKSDDVVGAFYWRKGRSQLLFINNRLNEQNIMLPKSYQKFIIDEL